jgi:GNAT superfamily N-acetyltransferase
MSEPPVKREGEPESGSEPELELPCEQPCDEHADERTNERRAALLFRMLNYKDISEVRSFITLLYAISAEAADPFHFAKSPQFIDRCVVKARREEKPENTFSGLALEGKEMVGVHVLRRFDEGPLVGAQIAGLWVAERCRRRGVARRLKAMGEAWARSIGADFLNSNVLVRNDPMLELNRKLGFESYRVNLRKRL